MIEEKPWGRIVTNDQTGESYSIVKNRRLWVADENFSLDAQSLVGSWFLVLHELVIVWKGVIVAEPQAARYLCDIEILEPNAEHVQRVFALDTIMGLGDEGKRLLENSFGNASAPIIDPVMEWRLYDSEDKVNAAYVNWVHGKSSAEHSP